MDMMVDPLLKRPSLSFRSLIPEIPFALLLLAFTLFPIAHLSVFGLPLYWSEGALLLSIIATSLLRRDWLIARLKAIYGEEKRLFIFAGLFLSGIGIAYLVNPHTFSMLGEIKSFSVLPVVFLAAVLVWGDAEDRLQQMALAWSLGITGAVGASLFAALSGWYLYDGRLAGLYQSPNHLAMLIAPGVLLVASFFRSAATGNRYRLLTILTIMLTLFTLGLSRSYAAWFALGVALFASVLLGKKAIRPAVGLFFAFLLVLGVFMVREQGSEKWRSFISGDERSSLASRMMIWRSAAKITADSFPLGIGPGRFQEVYLEYQRFYPPYLEWAVPTPHNLYLHFLLEGGVLALIGFLGSVGTVVVRAWRLLTVRTSGASQDFLVLGLALLTFYLIYGFVDTPYMKNDLALAVWGSLGFTLAAARLRV